MWIENPNRQPKFFPDNSDWLDEVGVVRHNDSRVEAAAKSVSQHM